MFNLILLAAFCVSSSMPVALSDDGGVEYTFLVAGQTTGTETIATTADGANTVYQINTSFVTAQGQRIELKSALTLDGEGELVSFSSEGTIGSFPIKTELAVDPESGRIRGKSEYLGEREIETELPDDIVFNHDMVHSMGQFAARYDDSGPAMQTLRTFDPVFLEISEASLELLDKFTLDRDGTETEIRHFFVKTGSLGAHLFVDAEGSVVQISMPLSVLTAVKEGWGGAIEIKLPEPDLEAETHYSEEEVTFQANEVEIAGAVTIPDDGKRKHPALFLVSGSGPQDLNEDTPVPGPYGLKAGLFRTIADRLSNAGFLVLRYNDYGVAPSGGVYQTATLIDRVNVARGALRYLQSRRDVDKKRIGVIGHSEGGIIAPIIAVEDPELRVIALMAGTARPIDEVVFEQSLALSDSLTSFEASIPLLIESWREVRSGKDWGRFGGQDNQFLGWFRSQTYHDPKDTLVNVKCRVLILNGEMDRQVLPGNALSIALALEQGGNQDYTIKLFPGLDHLFMKSPSGGMTSDYADFRRRLCPDFLEFLKSWLKDNL